MVRLRRMLSLLTETGGRMFHPPILRYCVRRRIRVVILLIAVGVICISPATADRKRQLQQQPSTPVGLVKFELSALGPRNEPITDLRSAECQVSEDGKRQVIALFHYDGNRQQKAAPPDRKSSPIATALSSAPPSSSWIS